PHHELREVLLLAGQARVGGPEAPAAHPGEGVKFRPKIDEHDFQFKKRNVERFLNDGNCGIGLLGRQRPSLADYVRGPRSLRRRPPPRRANVAYAPSGGPDHRTGSGVSPESGRFGRLPPAGQLGLSFALYETKIS